MARPFIITDDELIKLIEAYRKEYPKKKIRYTDIESFAKAQGLNNVKATNFKKRPVITEYIKKVNEDDISTHVYKVITYIPLDVNQFLKDNPTTPKIRASLTERESYIASIMTSASYVNSECKKIKQLNYTLSSENKSLKETVERLKTKEEVIAEKNKRIEYLESIISKNFYPEVATALLNKDYIAEGIKESQFSESRVLPSSDVSIFKNSELDSLFEDLEDDI